MTIMLISSDIFTIFQHFIMYVMIASLIITKTYAKAFAGMRFAIAKNAFISGERRRLLQPCHCR